jgi:hypothetical protein
MKEIAGYLSIGTGQLRELGSGEPGRLSYAALTFCAGRARLRPEEVPGRIGAILPGYGLDTSNHRQLITLMVRRARAMYDLLVIGGRTGQQPWARLYADGHATFRDRSPISSNHSLRLLSFHFHDPPRPQPTGRVTHWHQFSSFWRMVGQLDRTLPDIQVSGFCRLSNHYAIAVGSATDSSQDE